MSELVHLSSIIFLLDIHAKSVKMYIFKPLDGDVVIANIELTVEQLHNIKVALQSALDYNPSSAKFAEVLAEIQPLLGESVWSRWIASMQGISMDEEREDRINFMFEDWLSIWRIANFVDDAWMIAKIEKI